MNRLEGPPQLPGLRVMEEIGRGARTVVYRARRKGRTFAVKVHRSGPNAEDAALAFRREAAILARLHHPALAEILEVGELDGRPYLIMEHVEGRTLAALIEQRRMPEYRVVAVGTDLCAALVEVHRHGLVHRDIKPRNVIVDDSGRARLIDFGLAAANAEVASEVAGTFLYSAPEQTGMLSRPVDGRADLYALGVMLFECATGAPPYQADDVAELIRLHAMAPIPPAEGVSAALAAILGRLLSKDPDDRYQTAAGLLHDLEHIVALNDTAGEPPLGREDRIAPVDLPIIGREQELSRLRSAWGAALGGSGGVVLAQGVAGTGKSRLLREVMMDAERTGATVLVAKCAENDPMPFAPVRAALDDHIWRLHHSPDPEVGLARLREAAGDNGPLLARLSAVVASALGTQVSESTSGHDELQEAVANFLLALGAEPTFLLVDDIQWLDEASLRVLTLVAQGARQAPFLVAATARSEEEYTVATQRFRGEVGPWTVGRVDVGPLDENAVAKLVSAHLGGGRLDPTLSALVARRSHGSPFAVGEYVFAMLDAGLLRPSWGTWVVDTHGLEEIALPTDVMRLVLRRVERLGPRPRQVLTSAAILGARFDPLLLPAMTGLDAEVVLAAVAEAARDRLVEPTDGGDYAFIHDRVREALLAELPEDDLKNLHQQAAETLDTHDQRREQIYAIAFHYGHGFVERNPRRVYETSLDAGLRAMSEYAAVKAWDLLSRADDVAREHGFERNTELGNALGISAAHTGRFTEAVHHLEAALKRSETALERARLHVSLADLRLWAHCDTVGAWSNISAAFAEVGRPWPDSVAGRLWGALTAFVRASGRSLVGAENSAGHALEVEHVLSRLYVLAAGVAYFDMDNVRFLETSVRQYESGTRLPASKEFIDGNLAFSMLWAVLGLRGWSAANISNARQAAIETSDRWSLGTTYLYEGFTLNQMGDAVAAEETVRAALELHANWLETVDYLAGTQDLCWNLFIRGYTTEAWQWSRRATERCERVAPDFKVGAVFIYSSSIEAMLGRGAEANRHLEDAEHALHTYSTGAYGWAEYYAHAIFVKLESGALDELDDAIAAFEGLRLNPMLVTFHVQLAYVFAAYARLAQARENQGKDARRLTHALAAIRTLGRAVTVDATRGHLEVCRAQYAVLTGDSAAARKALERASALAISCDSPWVEFEVQVLRAEMLQANGHTAAATRAAKIAQRVAAEHGWSRRYRRLRDRFQLASHTRSAHTSSTGGPDNSRLKQHLDALLSVSIAVASARGPIHQAQLALDEVVRLLGAERAFLFFAEDDGETMKLQVARDNQGGELPLGTPYSRTVVDRVRVTREAVVSSGTNTGDVLRSESAVAQGLRSILAAPMLLRDRLVGVVYLDTTLARGVFTEGDVEVLTAIANQVAVTVERTRLQRRIEREEAHRSALERFHAPDVVKRLMMQRSDAEGETHSGLFLEPMEVTVLFCDLSDFTSFCDNHSAGAVARLLNAYLSRMTEITFAYDGTVDKYIGDAVMCIFGAPFQAEDDALRAVQCGMDMRRALRHLVASGDAGEGTDHLDIHIGINTGAVVVGTIGSERRMEYTALGDAVNIAARLQGVASKGQIVIGPATAEAVRDVVDLLPLGPVALKGKRQAVEAFEVLGSIDEDDLTDELQLE